MRGKAQEIMCDVRGIAYDFERRIGRLYMAEDNCCDMSGCIEFFSGIDPDVRRIETFAGEVPDTVYIRDRDVPRGHRVEWTARLPAM
ncbi:hypothetical protein SAMN02990966_06494 [Rhodospirillales bacterium URHD0017]|nr:hypothetical protein SAMN02990966_06494 [Rhodospirillales bacterium URHD0017]